MPRGGCDALFSLLLLLLLATVAVADRPAWIPRVPETCTALSSCSYALFLADRELSGAERTSLQSVAEFRSQYALLSGASLYELRPAVASAFEETLTTLFGDLLLNATLSANDTQSFVWPTTNLSLANSHTSLFPRIMVSRNWRRYVLRDDPYDDGEDDNHHAGEDDDDSTPDYAHVWSLSSTRAIPVQKCIPWGMDRIDQIALPYDARNRQQISGAGSNIYIVDTGINVNHSEFQPFGRATLDFAFPFLADACTTCSPPQPPPRDDCNGHGTHVASLAAGWSVGVSPGANVHSVKVLDCSGTGTVTSVSAGLIWIINHGQRGVINLSFGSDQLSLIEWYLLQTLYELGYTIVAAGGNDNDNACSSFPSALFPITIGVGATTRDDVRASFSNYGRCIAINAPGSQIKGANFRNINSYIVLSGTSMAAPFVSGAAAIALLLFPAANGNQIQAFLQSSGTFNQLRDLRGSPNILLYTFPWAANDATAPSLRRWTDGKCVSERLVNAFKIWIIFVILGAVALLLCVLTVAVLRCWRPCLDGLRSCMARRKEAKHHKLEEANAAAAAAEAAAAPEEF